MDLYSRTVETICHRPKWTLCYWIVVHCLLINVGLNPNLIINHCDKKHTVRLPLQTCRAVRITSDLFLITCCSYGLQQKGLRGAICQLCGAGLTSRPEISWAFLSARSLRPWGKCGAQPGGLLLDHDSFVLEWNVSLVTTSVNLGLPLPLQSPPRFPGPPHPHLHATIPSLDWDNLAPWSHSCLICRITSRWRWCTHRSHWRVRKKAFLSHWVSNLGTTVASHALETFTASLQLRRLCMWQWGLIPVANANACYACPVLRMRIMIVLKDTTI